MTSIGQGFEDQHIRRHDQLSALVSILHVELDVGDLGRANPGIDSASFTVEARNRNAHPTDDRSRIALVRHYENEAGLVRTETARIRILQVDRQPSAFEPRIPYVAARN